MIFSYLCKPRYSLYNQNPKLNFITMYYSNRWEYDLSVDKEKSDL